MTAPWVLANGVQPWAWTVGSSFYTSGEETGGNLEGKDIRVLVMILRQPFLPLSSATVMSGVLNINIGW